MHRDVLKRCIFAKFSSLDRRVFRNVHPFSGAVTNMSLSSNIPVMVTRIACVMQRVMRSHLVLILREITVYYSEQNSKQSASNHKPLCFAGWKISPPT